MVAATANDAKTEAEDTGLRFVVVKEAPAEETTQKPGDDAVQNARPQPETACS
jgi:hypothetical protein